MKVFHALDTSLRAPARFTNPFCYEPHALCQLAIGQVAGFLRGEAGNGFATETVDAAFAREIALGKMFGVLVVEQEGRLGYLAGYSGQIVGRSDWPGFVPAVFDYLQPEGYFKTHEACITALNHEAAALEQSDERKAALGDVAQAKGDMERAVAEFKAAHGHGRKEGEDEEAYVRRRQFENAELRRLKLSYRQRMDEAAQRLGDIDGRLTAMKRQRRQMSDSLQSWLFRHFLMRNGRGETKDIETIFRDYGLRQGGAPMSPPAGTGECCEPKLLQYAFLHGLRPRCMAMFWWGESPKDEVRHHLQCYPACNGKCKPLLWWMLQGLDVDPNPLEADRHSALPVVYEDGDICVVCKPAGMLSVPGKSGRESVYSLMRSHCPQAEGPLIVHRLDMATSGLMVIAKTWQAYHDLQGQFVRHEVRKRYVARLSKPVGTENGRVSLPLRPDLCDRPRQVVDRELGKEATTYYERIGDRRVALYPQTGRTHQLRVHCAHREGLDNPIEGDPLYGKGGGRLCLHAERLTFRHPRTGEELTFEAPAEF